MYLSTKYSCPALGATNTAVSLYIRHGHHTADTYGALDKFHMCCLRRIANVKWQDMIPNTVQSPTALRTKWHRTSHHVKRAQTCACPDTVRMADDRIPKAVFYVRRTRCRSSNTGRTTKVVQGRDKAMLKSCGIPHNTWEATATVPFGVVPATPVYETMKRRSATS